VRESERERERERQKRQRLKTRAQEIERVNVSKVLRLGVAQVTK